MFRADRDTPLNFAYSLCIFLTASKTVSKLLDQEKRLFVWFCSPPITASFLRFNATSDLPTTAGATTQSVKSDVFDGVGSPACQGATKTNYYKFKCTARY